MIMDGFHHHYRKTRFNEQIQAYATSVLQLYYASIFVDLVDLIPNQVIFR